MAELASQPRFFDDELNREVVDLLKTADILPHDATHQKVGDVPQIEP